MWDNIRQGKATQYQTRVERQCNTIIYKTMQCNTIQCNTL